MRKYLALFLSAFAALAIGCDSSNGEFVVTPVQPPVLVDMAALRVANPSGVQSNLVVQVDNTVVDADLDAQESTPYIEVEVGTHTVTITDGTNTLATTTIVVAANTYYTSVYIPTPLFAAQTTVGAPQLLNLTDNVVPTAGQLNVRLCNAGNYDGQISLFNDNEELLLGPVQEGASGPYVAQGASAANSAFFVVLFEITELPDATATFTQESNGDQLVESLVQEVGTSGANISIFVNFDHPTGQAFITALVDEAADGSRAILSTATVNYLVQQM